MTTMQWLRRTRLLSASMGQESGYTSARTSAWHLTGLNLGVGWAALIIQILDWGRIYFKPRSLAEFGATEFMEVCFLKASNREKGSLLLEVSDSREGTGPLLRGFTEARTTRAISFLVIQCQPKGSQRHLHLCHIK